MTVSLRRLRRRPSLRATLVALVVGLTGLTGAAIGGLAWHAHRQHSRAILDAAMEQAARLVATNTTRFLRDAESAVRLGPALVAQGQLDLADDHALEHFLLAVLDAHPDLTWSSYGDRDDRFVGAKRDTQGTRYINHSFPVRGHIRLVEDRLLPEGGRVPGRRSDNHGYRPHERPYFQEAERRRALTWTEPYEFYAAGGLGISCAAPVLDASGRVRGVFTIDFSLDRLARVLDAVEVSPRGRIFLATRRGAVLVGPQQPEGGRREIDALAHAIAGHGDHDDASAFTFEHGGERYLGRTMSLPIGDQGWLAAVVVPERDYTEEVDALAWQTVIVGVLALGLALGAGIALARWIARPLGELAESARRIRHGDLDVPLAVTSHDEIGVLTRAMRDMVHALKDRDTIRSVLGRYVSPELAERCLRDPEALRPGGELREVVILMSDLRGFSQLSVRLGPEPMIRLLNQYLARMTAVIHEHGGMIDEFIGDAILVLFGAPFGRADDAERAVRCAWHMQQALAELNEANAVLGLPSLAMGIAVHRGSVVAGHIGSRDHVKYGVVGPPVNLVSRIQAISAGGEVLLTDTVLSRTRELVRVGRARSLSLKGATGPVTVHSMVGLFSAAAAPQASAHMPAMN